MALSKFTKIVIVGFFAIVCLTSFATTETISQTYQYDIKQVAKDNETRFYFFRTNTRTGEIESMKFDNPSGDKVSWHKITEKGHDAFTYIIK